MRRTDQTVRIANPLARLLTPALLLAAGNVQASFLAGEALDKFADVLAIVVLCIVPIGAIVVFWLVHVLPEKIAEKRHHPQKEAITTLCLLSLAFGGLLWPIAWLWAYTRPVGYRVAYGTDKHDDYFRDMAVKARGGGMLREDLAHLREELDSMAARGNLPPQLKDLRAELDSLHARAVAAQAAGATPASAPAARKE